MKRVPGAQCIVYAVEFVAIDGVCHTLCNVCCAVYSVQHIVKWIMYMQEFTASGIWSKMCGVFCVVCSVRMVCVCHTMFNACCAKPTVPHVVCTVSCMLHNVQCESYSSQCIVWYMQYGAQWAMCGA